MKEARFRFSTEILRRLGEELNPSLDQGVLELVKNAYDADASRCVIELRDTLKPGGSIIISDDGIGMTSDDIIDGWLVLGSSRKSISQLTTKGRVPAGNKGLGRLAALRLGTRAIVTSVSRAGRPTEVSLALDWQKFDEASLVDDVLLPLHQQLAVSPRYGTHIELCNLRNPVGAHEVRRLARALVLLADPFDDQTVGFRPELKAPEYAEFSRLVAERYFGDADYHLVATLEGGIARARVVDFRGKPLYEAAHSELSSASEGELYRCPDASFDLWSFVLTSASFELRKSTLSEVRVWLKEFGGVHLYQNGLRVSPYGGPTNDWLEMNLRRVRSPEERPSTNNSIGRVVVSDTQGRLVQKTDRSGLIEGPDYLELRRFAIDCLEWMARCRMQDAEERRARRRTEAPTRSSKAKEAVDFAIQKAPARTRERFSAAFERYDRARKKEIQTLHKEVQLYRTLSTAGITAATFAHESAGNPLKVIEASINTIERRGKKALSERFGSILEKPVESVRRAVSALSVLASATLSLVRRDKRRRGRVDVHEVVSRVVKTFTPFLEGRDVEVRQTLAIASPYYQGTEAALESLVTNLINNCVNAFELAGIGERVIELRTHVLGESCVIEVLDNGPGITGISLGSIWLPGETTRASGTGLGLTIVRDTVKDLGGKVSAEAAGELGGATFRIELPIMGA